MSIADRLLPEFDHEMATTRKFLERIPDGQFAFKPHPKSWRMADLAIHLSTIPSWITETIQKESIDIAPVGQPPYRPPEAKTHQDLLEIFDRNVAAGRAALTGASDETLMKPWTLVSGGQPIFTMPRIAVLRAMVMNHSIHHRAQLGMYLRLIDVPVPGAYGPSADEAQG